MADSYPTSPSKPRRGTARGASSSYGGGSSGIVEGKRNRGGKKNYVVDSTEDDDEEDGDEDLDAEGDEDDDLGDEDADGEADADGDIDMVIPTPALKKAAQPPKGILKSSAPLDDDDEDDELSDTNLDATNYGYDSLEEDAEGEEDDDMEVVAPSRVKSGRNDDDDDEDLDSDDEMASRGETPDLSRMTKRQRARFEDDDDGAFMKLSNEVQTKKHFTAEELSMRRTELARRRRNLSEKRNEEVKMETVNKLLKKQPPKTNKKAKTLEEELAEQAARRPNPTLVRWVSTKTGETLSVPDEILESPINVAFMDTMKPQPRTKLIEEVA